MQSTLSLVWQGERVIKSARNETAMHARAQASNLVAKANRASHGGRVSPHSQAKVRARKIRENPREPKVRLKVPKAYTKAKHYKRVSQVLKT